MSGIWMVRLKLIREPDFVLGWSRLFKTAEINLKEGRNLYGLGEMVHNESEIQTLEGPGIENHQQAGTDYSETGKGVIQGPWGATFHISAGEKHRIEIIDGTCPIV